MPFSFNIYSTRSIPYEMQIYDILQYTVLFVELNSLFFKMQFLYGKTVARSAITKTFNIVRLDSFPIFPISLLLWTFHFPSISFLYKRGNLWYQNLRCSEGWSMGKVNVLIWLKTLIYFLQGLWNKSRKGNFNTGFVNVPSTFSVMGLESFFFFWKVETRGGRNIMRRKQRCTAPLKTLLTFYIYAFVTLNMFEI